LRLKRSLKAELRTAGLKRKVSFHVRWWIVFGSYYHAIVSTDSFDPTGILTADDVTFIEGTGRDPKRVVEQIKFLREPRRAADILRPATIGDGIHQLDSYDSAKLNSLHEEAAAAGRLSAFIPASGSGTRLFQNLRALHDARETNINEVRQRAAQGDATAQDALVLIDNLKDFAIWEDLKRRGATAHTVDEILKALFDEQGPKYHDLPKGLIPFHRYGDHVRTAFAEHIHEAAELVTDSQKICRIHFTISAAHRESFEREWLREQRGLEQLLGLRFQVDFSEQSANSDTIAVDLEGNVHRNESGQIAFRPGGHGSLLQNLADTNHDVVLIKNIDNVTRQELAEKIVLVRKQIAGLLLLIESTVHQALRELRAGGDPTSAMQLLKRFFGREMRDESRSSLFDELDRPLRVCGVVRALGHAGGGPFWIADRDHPGPWLQIVEGAETDQNDAAAQTLFQQSTHFNPVDIVCSLRNVDGQPFDLKRFTTPERALVARKNIDGIPSLLYEHPGLWNGGMGLWNTVLVEIPDFTFNPVKTISDLYGPGHREG
jgi:Domain of unknown function (DUF4301)